ncbi:MAG: TetR family transcriptional regulator [Coprobacillus sp.]|nr:TetR family transcriptional regulator [Coprobacillus sp.]
MGIDIKKMLADSLLKLCENKNLEALTIQDLLNDTGISRQTFYNHFIDKNDLIHYVYNTKIVPDFHYQNMTINFYESLLITFKNMQRYHRFMKQACMMEGQNCLKDYIFEHCKEFDLKWHQVLYGYKPMPDTLKFATEYHATASTSMTLSWILSDMPVSCEEIVKMIVEMRAIGMEVLFKDGEFQGNPYLKD